MENYVGMYAKSVILSYCDLIFHRLSAQFRETGVYT